MKKKNMKNMRLKKKTKVLSIICIVFGGVAIPGGILVNGIIQDMTYNTYLDDALLFAHDVGIPVMSEIGTNLLKALIINITLDGLNISLEEYIEGFTIYEPPMTLNNFFTNPTAEFQIDKHIKISDIIDMISDDIDIDKISDFIDMISDFINKGIDIDKISDFIDMISDFINKGIEIDMISDFINKVIEMISDNIDLKAIIIEMTLSFLDFFKKGIDIDKIPDFIEMISYFINIDIDKISDFIEMISDFNVNEIDRIIYRISDLINMCINFKLSDLLDTEFGYIDIQNISGLQKFIYDNYSMRVDFSTNTQHLLLYGNEDEELPGLIKDFGVGGGGGVGGGVGDFLDSGSVGGGGGVGDFLELYKKDVGALAAQYECTPEALKAVVLYLNEYLEDEIITLLFNGIDIDFGVEALDSLNYALELLGLNTPLSDIFPLSIHLNPFDLIPPQYNGCGSIYDITKVIFFEQWANGTILGEVMIPYPGIPFPFPRDELHYGFEVGIPVATNMSLTSAESLWDKNNDCALTSEVGKDKWIDLVANRYNDALYNELKTAHGLDDHAMECLITWIPRFQHDMMPYLAGFFLGLPMDTISLGALIEGACIVIGGALIVLGSACLVVAKRRVSIRTKRIPPPLKMVYPNIKKNPIGALQIPFAEIVMDLRIP